ncbi:MAG: hypothetical protein OXC93_13945 [Rhodospirillaceae bacterium]|nr:hypothetical protein [Rhodospirillaceae bacterium]
MKRIKAAITKVGCIYHHDIMGVGLQATESPVPFQNCLGSIQLANPMAPDDGSRLRIIAHYGDMDQFRGVGRNRVLSAEVVIMGYV